MTGSTKLMTPGGGGLILQPASSVASDVTVSVPSANCTLDIQGPAFSAYQSTNQSTVTSNTWTKVVFQSEEYDTANCFDSTTNYRFTPTVAGYYNISAAVAVLASSTNIYVSVYKNGTLFKSLTQPQAAGQAGGSSQLYLNGSTDYIEVYVYIGTSQQLYGNQGYTYFQAVLMRAA